MIKENQKFLNFINVLLDSTLMFFAIILSFYLRYDVMDGVKTISQRYYYLILSGDILIQLIVFRQFHLYEANRKRRLSQELLKLTAAATINFVLLFTILYFSKDIDFSRIAMLIYLALKIVFLGIKRIALDLTMRYMRKTGYNQRHVLIVGSNVMARNCYKELLSSPELGYTVHGYFAEEKDWTALPYLGKIEKLAVVLEKKVIDEVFVAPDLEEQKRLDWIIYQCDLNGVRFSLIPFYSEYMTTNVEVDSLNGIPILSLRKLPLDHLGNAMIKRAMDIVGSAMLILLFSPVMAAVAIGVKLSSPGPIIFKQERVGLGKKPFYMYKFRSMYVNAEQNTGWTTNTDPRKTKFGNFIRKYSLDELPQFFNVLLGSMSLVGPRPEIPYFVEQFKWDVPLYLNRQQVRPGITGWAQIHGLRGDTSIPERVKFDRWYIKNWSVGLDIWILLRTLFGGFKNSEVYESGGQNGKTAVH